MTSTTISPAVRAANTLTAQWCARLGDEDFVASGAGLWPLLALLASAADFDRPFGFIAVHRPSRLAIVAGRVSSPFTEGAR